MRSLLLYLSLAILAIAPASTPAQQAGSSFSPSAQSLYEQGRNALTGTGVNRNDILGVDYMRRSADMGYAPAQVAMGYFYDTGNFLAQEPQQSVAFYRKAADQGDRLAQWSLGRLYLNNTGVPRDLDQAERWLQQAANQGDPFGEYLLGTVKEERTDFAAAAQWYRKAAQQGLPQAQEKLGRMLMEGKNGVPQDKFEAYVWLLVSFDNGNRAVTTSLSVLEGDFNGSQVEQAKSKARSLDESTARTVTAGGCTGWEGEFREMPEPPPLRLQVHCH